MTIRNAPTRLMKDLGYSHGYEYPHDAKDAVVGQEYLPDALRGRQYYHPTQRGREKAISQRLQDLARIKARLRRSVVPPGSKPGGEDPREGS